MIRYSGFLAQMDGLNPLNPTAPVTKSTGLVFLDVLVILATALVLGIVLLLWARYYVRKRRRRRHHHRHEHEAHSSSPLVPTVEDEELHHDGHRHRKRRRRRDHRPRNPTLGETGGLPPAKTEPSSNPPL